MDSSETKKGAVERRTVVVQDKTLQLHATSDGQIELQSGSWYAVKPLVSDARGVRLDISILGMPTTQLQLLGKAPEFRLQTSVPAALSCESRGGLLTMKDAQQDAAFNAVMRVERGPVEAAIAALVTSNELPVTLSASRFDKLELMFPTGTTAAQLDGTTLVQTHLNIECAFGASRGLLYAHPLELAAT